MSAETEGAATNGSPSLVVKLPPFVLIDEGGLVHLLGDDDETTACGAPADFMEAYERPPDGSTWCGFCSGRTT